MTAKVLTAPQGFTFGCDPELFVFNKEGVAVSAEGLIPGDKINPHKVKCGAVQVDGMAAEFNIDPVSTFEEWNYNINTVMSQLKGMLPAGYRLEAVPSVEFTQDVWDSASEDAKQLGCSPDFNAWTGDVNMPPEREANSRLCCAGGHIHFGWKDDQEIDLQHINHCYDFVKQLDWYLGGWSLGMDQDITRRRLYGKAGACRVKPYGVEYRVLSNFWITTKDRRLAVWNRMVTAINHMNKLYIPEKIPTKYNKFLIQAIEQGEGRATLEKVAYFPMRTLDASYRRF